MSTIDAEGATTDEENVTDGEWWTKRRWVKHPEVRLGVGCVIDDVGELRVRARFGKAEYTVFKTEVEPATEDEIRRAAAKMRPPTGYQAPIIDHVPARRRRRR
ncbi:hypothetical protein [Streptomyces boninensis]|uniref:hypothetical protein n=1 Tax=Streptomyces boninensis TaxID=2039455 RepID=UPI003B226EFC